MGEINHQNSTQRTGIRRNEPLVKIVLVEPTRKIWRSGADKKVACKGFDEQPTIYYELTPALKFVPCYQA